VASLMIVLGLNTVFSSFLLNMFMSDQRDRLESPARAPAASAEPRAPGEADRSAAAARPRVS